MSPRCLQLVVALRVDLVAAVELGERAGASVGQSRPIRIVSELVPSHASFGSEIARSGISEKPSPAQPESVDCDEHPDRRHQSSGTSQTPPPVTVEITRTETIIGIPTRDGTRLDRGAWSPFSVALGRHTPLQLLSARVSVQTLTEHELKRECRRLCPTLGKTWG